MAIVDIAGLKEHLAFTPDLGSTEDAVLQRLLDGAQSYVEAVIGFEVEDSFGGVGQEPVPAALVHCVYQLAVHWWEIRGHDEAASLMKAAPVWVSNIDRKSVV